MTKEQQKEIILNFLKFTKEVYDAELREPDNGWWLQADAEEIVDHYLEGK